MSTFLSNSSFGWSSLDNQKEISEKLKFLSNLSKQKAHFDYHSETTLKVNLGEIQDIQINHINIDFVFQSGEHKGYYLYLSSHYASISSYKLALKHISTDFESDINFFGLVKGKLIYGQAEAARTFAQLTGFKCKLP